MARYSQLAPLDLDTRLTLAILALGFFSPVKYAENMMRLGRTPSPGVVKPLSGKDFLDYLKERRSIATRILGSTPRESASCFNSWSRLDFSTRSDEGTTPSSARTTASCESSRS